MNHNILIVKLNHYGTRGTTLDWFQSYLTNRKKNKKQNTSTKTVIPYGVSQGSAV